MADGPDATLDPEDWMELRTLGHQILDDMFDHLEGLRARPVWQQMPDAARDSLRAPLPRGAGSLADAYRSLQDNVIPYTVGNPHPGFMGWVHGAGTPVGIVAEMIAGALNANVGGRNQAPVEVERQVSNWMAALFGFPGTARGVFVTGTSIANFMGVVVARTHALGRDVRAQGLAAHADLRAYASAEAHGCIAKAMDLAGFGTDALRSVRVDAAGHMDVSDLAAQVAADRRNGLQPFLVVASAGTVNTGAIDPLATLADFARDHGMWLHVDGAYAALGVLAPDVAPLLDGIARADSLAFDFHKWGQVPYDAGFFMARDGAHMLDAFAAPAAYLQRAGRGLAAGEAWPCDLGPDLSRGFRALKTWLTFQVYGADAIGRSISATCALARYLAERIAAEPDLELAAPVTLNIVCFRFVCADPERVNREIVLALYDEGRVAPSATTLDGRYAIRAAIVNHRTGRADIDALVDAVLRAGRLS
ncbi:aminotransferase class V-fold PLP-dependent enzyme [Telluria mixta]|uniref:Aminotransferase class V-fold PLP-dependent enzyme n=1 Tax=Telluria mixta TaxID=34071 RepID=A0ABT2BV08_9BURK|nr:aminotransferase class V-fold PLP-dependent enzyme [Telluria mixta]MCS0628264.1 aminotransferase class V-fold PLP-dependent enzyme [Telluria mixta]WEM93624.1 aminotransferase class V-fold PLP-dependent enzyme [Telluria mixta]